MAKRFWYIFSVLKDSSLMICILMISKLLMLPDHILSTIAFIGCFTTCLLHRFYYSLIGQLFVQNSRIIDSDWYFRQNKAIMSRILFSSIQKSEFNYPIVNKIISSNYPRNRINDVPIFSKELAIQHPIKPTSVIWKVISITLIIMTTVILSTKASVSVTVATGGIGISADKAYNATTPAYSTLGNIVITEGANADFAAQSGTTLILTAPSGWQFNAGVGSVSFTASRNITSAAISVSSSAITVTISVTGTSLTDALTISGIQVQATVGGTLPASGNILRTTANPGTATIAGITNGTTNFGSLSQVAGTMASLTMSPVSSTQTASTAFSVTITAKDQFNNTASSFISTVNMTTSAGSVNPATSNAFTSGSLTQSFYVTGTGTNQTITASNTSPATTVTSNTFTVNAATASSKYSINNGNWEAIGNWSTTSGGSSCGCVPVAGDAVYIEGDAVTVNGDANCASLTFTTTTASTLSVNSGITLNVSNTITQNNAATASTSATISGSGTVNCGSFTMGNNVIPTATVNYTFTSSIANLNIGGNVNLYSYDPGGGKKMASIFNFSTGTITIGGTISCVGQKNQGSTFTMATGSQNGNLNFSGAGPFFNLSSSDNSGTVAFTVDVSGTTTTVNYNGSAYAQTIPFAYPANKINAAASTTAVLSYTNLTTNNTNVSGATLGAAITGTNVTGNLSVQSGILDNGGFAIALASAKNFSVSNGATFDLSGTSGMVTVSGGGTKTFGATSTVSYSGGAQTVTAEGYGNLNLSAPSSSTKTFSAATTIAGRLTINNNATALFSASGNTANQLVLNGTIEPLGTWGGTSSGASTINSTYFSTVTTSGRYITVGSSGTLDHFAISSISSPRTAGIAITGITITAQDVDNNTYGGFTSTVSYSGTAGITGNSPAFTGGVLSGVSVTPTIAGTGMTLVVTGSSKTGTATFNVTPGALDHFAISSISAPQTAGTAITGITLTAQDLNNNTVTSFVSTVAFSGTAGITGNSSAFTGGVLSGVSVTPTIAGTGMTLVVTGSSKTGTTTFNVTPGALDHFAISSISSPQTAGTAITGITLTAQDVNNNTVTSFTGTGNSVTYGGTAGITGNSALFTAGQLTGVSVTPITSGSGRTFTVTNSGKSGSATFDVNNPVPSISNISPNTKCAGDATFTLTVNGTNFNSSSVVKIAGTSRTTSYVSPTQITASILATDITTSGTPAITVFNPTPGGGTSGSAPLTVTSAGTWLGAASSDWTNANNWCGGVPDATIDVVIPASATYWPNISSGKANCNSLSFSGSASTLNFTGGNLVVAGNISFSSGVITSSTSASTLSVGGTWTGTGTTFTPGSNLTVNFAGVSQTVPTLAFYNLTLSGSGTDHLAGVTTINGNLLLSTGTSLTADQTTNTPLAISGNLTVGANTTLNISGYSGSTPAFSVSGITDVTGILALGHGSKTFGDITIENGGNLTKQNPTINESYFFNGSITNNGTFNVVNNSSSGVLTFQGTGKTLSGAYPIVVTNVSMSGSYINNGTFSVTNYSGGVASPFTGSGSLILGAAGILNVAGDLTITTLDATSNAGNTVNYTGADQTVKAINYYNLTFSGSGAKSISNASGSILTSNILNIVSSSQASVTTSGALVNVLQFNGVAQDNAYWGYNNTTPAPPKNNTTYFANTGSGYYLQVGKGVMNKFEFSLASPQVNGTSLSGINTLTAKDVYGNTITTFDASANNVTITPNLPFTGSISGLSGTNKLTNAADFTSGVANLTALALKYTGNAATGNFTATSATSGYTGTSGGVTINPGTMSQLIMNPTTITAATAGSSVSSSFTSITAEDANGNICNSGPNTFTGIVTFGGTAGASGTSAAFSAGVLSTFPTLTPTAAGSSKTITATSGSVVSTTTITTINPGALDHFAISAISSPQTAGTAITGITLTAQDLNNNAVNSFVSTVAFSGTAGITGTSSAFTGGVLSGISVTPTIAGTGMTLVVTGSSKTGTSTFRVNPAAPSGSTSQTFCSSSSSTVAGLTPSGTAILWYATSSGGSPLSSSTTLTNSTHYYATQTINGCESTTRLDVAVTVNITPGAPSGAGSQTLCAGSTLADLAVSGSNLIWYDAANGGNLLASTTVVANNTHYYASQTTNSCESTARLNIAVTVNATGTWLGTTSTAWSDGSNWCGGVPTSSTDVIIPSGGNQPVIGTAALCNSITINSGATVILSGSNTLTVSGNFTNNGTFTPNSGTVTFNGTGTQSIGGSAVSTFNNLTVNKPSGEIFLTSDESVNGALTLTTGIVDGITNSKTLTIGATGSASAGSTASYVKGKLARICGSAGSNNFPVGNGNFHPMALTYTQLTGTSTVTVQESEDAITIPINTFPAKISSAITSIPRHWTVSQSGASAFSYTVNLDGAGINPAYPVIIILADASSVKLSDVTVSNPYYVSSQQFTSFSDLGLAEFSIKTSVADDSWNADGTWLPSGVPVATDNLFVNNTVTIGNSPAAVCNDLTINSGKSLTIGAGQTLTVNGALTNSAGTTGLILASDATGTASLIHNTNDVPATVNRYISGTGQDWHFLSSPVDAQGISGASWLPSGTYGNGTGYDLYVWNEPTSCWIYKLNTSTLVNWTTVHPQSYFVPGRGYLYSVQATNPTNAFAGNLNNGDITYPITDSGAVTTDNVDGFNLVGNPYPSSVDWQATGWTRSALKTSGSGYDMWIWSPADGNYGVFNSGGGSGTNHVTGYIAPMQGFFVRAAGAGNLGFANSVRVHAYAGDWKSARLNPEAVSLVVQSERDQTSDEVKMVFGYPVSQNGAAKLFSPMTTAPSLYLAAAGANYTVRYLTDTIACPQVPVWFKPGADGPYSLSANFDPGAFKTVLLEDVQKRVVQDLKTEPAYRFAALKSDPVSRFVLHFTPVKAEAGNELPAKITTNGTLIFADLTQLTGDTRVSVYDVLGRKLFEEQFPGGAQFTLNYNPGRELLLVRLQNHQGELVRKLLCNNTNH